MLQWPTWLHFRNYLEISCLFFFWHFLKVRMSWFKMVQILWQWKQTTEFHCGSNGPVHGIHGLSTIFFGSFFFFKSSLEISHLSDAIYIYIYFYKYISIYLYMYMFFIMRTSLASAPLASLSSRTPLWKIRSCCSTPGQTRLYQDPSAYQINDMFAKPNSWGW